MRLLIILASGAPAFALLTAYAAMNALSRFVG
jgi:hypothetical protein